MAKAAKPQGKGKAQQAASKAQAASKSKGAKAKENVEKVVVYDQKLYDQMLKDVPTYKLITTAIVSDRLKVNASLARRSINQPEKEGKIKRVIKSGNQLIYTR